MAIKRATSDKSTARCYHSPMPFLNDSAFSFSSCSKTSSKVTFRLLCNTLPSLCRCSDAALYTSKHDTSSWESTYWQHNAASAKRSLSVAQSLAATLSCTVICCIYLPYERCVCVSEFANCRIQTRWHLWLPLVVAPHRRPSTWSTPSSSTERNVKLALHSFVFVKYSSTDYSKENPLAVEAGTLGSCQVTHHAPSHHFCERTPLLIMPQPTKQGIQ